VVLANNDLVRLARRRLHPVYLGRIPPPKITRDNVETYVAQWAASLQLLNHKLPPNDQAYWGYEIGIEADHMITVWQSKGRNGYLTL
jgi:hypothetical protein